MDIDFEQHVYSVLSNSSVGKSAYQHLDYTYTVKTAEALADHNYTPTLLNYKIRNISNITCNKTSRIDTITDRTLQSCRIYHI